MEHYRKIGQIRPKSSLEIADSRISLGFEKLDRDVFDPEHAYDKVAACGVKKVRIQSGWQRTEKEKGVYDFAWLDSIVDNFLSRGIEPWICLCYGNALYTERARTVFGAVGCAPVETEEERQAWHNYVTAVVSRYRGRIRYYEVWNEPEGCWKPKANPVELGHFTIATAKAVKQADPEAKVIGGVVYQRSLAFLNTALRTGMAQYVDYLSFHEYTPDERNVPEKVEAFLALARQYNPAIELIQGESGSQSRRGGHGAMFYGAWSPAIQAKQLARHTMADLLSGVHFLSYFTCVDMIEALGGTVGDKSTYMDFGYFGILGADFDEDGRATGNYTPKPSYYTLQNICSVFTADVKTCTLPIFVHSEYSKPYFEQQLHRYDITSGCFEREGGTAFVYWYPGNIMTSSYLSSITVEVFSAYETLQLVDLMDGSVYEIPPETIEDLGDGVRRITELPIKDTPLLLTMGQFIV